MTLRRLVVWIAIVIGIVYLTVAGGGAFFGLYVGAFRVASVAVAVLTIATWLAWSVRHEFWRPRTALWPAILGCLGAMVVSAAGSSESHFAFDFLAYAFLLAGLYLLLQRMFADPVLGQRLIRLGVTLGFGLCLLYLGAVVLHWIDFWKQLGRFSVPPLRPGFEGLAYGNPSTVASVTVLLWLAAAANLGFSTGRSRAALISLGILTAAVVFISGSRGAWAGLAIAGAVLVPLWFTVADHRDEVRRLTADRRVRLGVGIGLVTILGVSVAFLPALIGRLTEPAADTRTAFYLASLRMFLAHPLTGLGPGTWTVERIHYTLATESDYYIPHAHNIWLQTLAELGIVGALAGAIGLVSIGGMLRRGWRSGSPAQRRLAWAGLAGLVYLGAHQLFDFYPNMPAVGFCLALVLARLDAEVTAVAPKREPAGMFRSLRAFPAIATATVIGLVLSTAWLARSEGAAGLQVTATDAANTGDWAQALNLANQALATDPGMPPYLFTAGLAAAHLGQAQTARDMLLKSAQIDDFPTAWLDVARLDIDLGDTAGAQDAMDRAMRIGYEQPQVALGVATLRESLGDHEGAVRALTAALIAAPGLASDPYWTDPSRRPMFESALGAALADAPRITGYQMALEAGRINDARVIAANLPASDRRPASLEVEAWAGDQSAFDTLHAIAIADPLDDAVVELCRRVAARSRDTDWTGPGPWDCDRAGVPGDLIIVRVSPPPTTRVVLPGPNAPWHFQYAYRRVTPVDELVPGLPHLAVVFV